MQNTAIKTLQKEIKESGLSGFLVTTPNNVRFLSGFHGSSGMMLVTANKAFLLTDFRYIQKAKAVLPKEIALVDITRMLRNPLGFTGAWQNLIAKHKLQKIAFESTEMTVERLEFFKNISKTAKLSPVKNLVENLRIIKSQDELKKLTRSQRINEQTLHKVVPLLKTGVTETEIGRKIQIIGLEEGAEAMSFDPIVAFAANSASPHHEPTNKKLAQNEVVLIDMGMKYQGYCSDMTRTFLPKKATNEQKEVYSKVLEAQLNCIKNLNSKLHGGQGDELARSVIKNAGYGENFGHSTGHGIGLDIHEAPNLSPGGNDKLPKGTVVTAEPGIYLPGNFGVRIEDMVIVEENKVSVMTKMPKSLADIMIL